MNKKLRKSSKNEAGDLIDDLTGKSYDTMGVGHTSVNDWTLNGITTATEKVEIFKQQISKHFNKINKIPPLDFVVIDYKYLDEISLAINQNPNYIKNQLDLYITQNHIGQISKLIKLNH